MLKIEVDYREEDAERVLQEIHAVLSDIEGINYAVREVIWRGGKI